MLVSVSPVPFIATTRSRECHVIAANMHSKSILRVVAEEIVKTNRDTHYFPSYEMAITCTRDPWQADQHHLTPEGIEGVMRLFDAMFVK